MDKEKVVIECDMFISTGYVDEYKQFIRHSFGDHEPAYILGDGEKYWYRHDKQYWIINKKIYNSIYVVNKIYKDKIIKTNDNISKKLKDMNIDYIRLENGWNKYEYLILDDIQRNEVILRYG